jgi:hypothetical protein
MDAAERHVPVMLERVVALLAPALAHPGAVVVDATLGLGGHSEAFLRQFPEVRLIGLDRDPAALRLAGERLAPYEERITLVHAVYDELPRVLEELDVPAIDGILFDLGVSSMQLDEAGRGFAYAQDAPLDMRMDPTGPTTAADIVNTSARPTWPGSCSSTARRSSPAGSRTGSSASARPSRSRTARGCPSWSATRSRRPPGGRAGIQRSGRSRRCGSR